MRRCFFFAMSILIFVCGCSMKKAIIIDNESNLEELINNSNIRQECFFFIAETDSLYNITLSQITKYYPVSFLRKSNDTDFFYTVWKNEMDSLFVICVFEKTLSDFRIIDFWEEDSFIDESSFSSVTAGKSTFDSIRSIFPCGYHYDGRDTGHGPLSIIHLTNGNTMTIWYNDAFIVEHLEMETANAIINQSDVDSIKYLMEQTI